MKKRYMLIVMLCGLIAIASAELTVTNGDFEADTAQTSNVTDWYDTVTTNTSNWWESTWAGPTVSPTGTPVLGLSYMFTTTNWAYQSLGTNDTHWQGMEVTYDVGSFTDAGGARDLGVTISVYESDGSFVPADNTDVDGAEGVTLIDSVSTLYESVAVGAVIADQTVTLDLRAAGSGEIFLRIENYAGATGEPWTAIDNVEISPAVYSFSYDAPEGNAKNIAIELTSSENDLVFTINDSTITAVDVQFGPQDDPNLTAFAAYKIVDGMSVAPGQYTVDLEGELTTDLNYNTTYYWKVIGYEPNSAPGATDFFEIPGPVSSFTTIPEAPSVTADYPVYQAVDAGEDVVLSVTGVAVQTYQWYKVGDPDLALTEGSDYSGVATDTLTILDLQLADEGYYYCTVSKTGFDPASTDPGRVMTHRLTSYYPFETTSIVDSNTITPDTVGGFDAILLQEAESAGMPTLDDANQLDASLGYYLQLDNADNATDPNGQYALIPAGVVDYEDMTISAWIYPKGGTVWNRVFDFGADTSSYLFLTPDNGSGSARFAIGGEGSEQLLSTTWLASNAWHHVAITLSGNTGRMYVNGELVATNSSMTNDPIDIEAVLNYIGKSQYAADAEYNGLLDELKIYNYALTTQEIGQEYVNLIGGWVCDYEAYDLGDYDYNGNCIVDLPDFAEYFATRWLDSFRIYPQE